MRVTWITPYLLAFQIKAFMGNIIYAMQADKLHENWKFGSVLKLVLIKELMRREKPSLTEEAISLDKFFSCKPIYRSAEFFKAFSYEIHNLSGK